jgi:formate dehydrogenase subunit beta
MAKVLELKKSVETGIFDLLQHLLESEKISGVFTLKRLSENKNGQAISYSLITNKKGLDGIIPFSPIMPRNAGGLISNLTLKGTIPGLLAIVVRPCELRALVELVKRNRGNLENLLIISSSCGGVYPTKNMVNKGFDKEINEYWTNIKNNEITEGLRDSCSGCSEFIPYNSDITFMVVGGGDIDKQCKILLDTPKAEGLVAAKDLGGKIIEGSLPEKIVNSILTKHESYKNTQFNELGVSSLNLKGLVDVFGKCIGCRGCRTACPICYCELCTFESQNAQAKVSEKELTRKGGMRMPQGTVYFHMTRLPHVSVSCVGCGSCEDACPMDIPLTTIFRKVSGDVQGVFQYLPGKNLDEKIPIKTFETNEYIKFED